MNSSALDAPYRELATSLTPTAVSQYLAATQPWQLETRQDHVYEVWSMADRDRSKRGRIMLPLATDYADFSDRFYDAIRALSHIYDWQAGELADHITATRADLFFVRLDQVATSDTIPLKQAETTIDAIYELLKAAATTAAVPHRTQRGGRLPTVVTDFLQDDIRLGHTKRGSFVFTVVTRLDRPSDKLFEVVGADVVPVFPRRVMETLARGLESTRDLAQGTATIAADEAAAAGLSAALVESLEEIAGSESLRSLELSFEWAATEARPSVGVEPIKLEHAQVNELTRVREQLLRDEEPPHRETLVGRVMSLARAEDEDLEGAESGSVVISAEVSGRRRNVHLGLVGDDHEHAIQAYRLKIPLIVTGDLVFERRAWRLLGDVEVDASMVKRASDSRRASIQSETSQT